jgi:hypothetical protein
VRKLSRVTHLGDSLTRPFDPRLTLHRELPQAAGVVDWRLRADTCEAVGLVDLAA